MNVYVLVQQSEDLLRSLGYVGAAFLNERDAVLMQRLSDQLSNDPFFNLVDENHQSYPFQLSAAWLNAPSREPMPLLFRFQWNHEEQEVQLDALEAWKPGKRMVWDNAGNEGVPRAGELAARLRGKHHLSASAEHLLSTQATVALVPLCHKGYIPDAAHCRGLLVDAIRRQQERSPDRQVLEVELFSHIPTSVFRTRMEFSYNSQHAQISLQSVSVYGTHKTLHLTDRDRHALPQAAHVVACLNEQQEDRQLRMMEQRLGYGAYLHPARWWLSNQLLPETSKLIPILTRLRAGGYLPEGNAAPEETYLHQAASRINAQFRYGFVVNNHYDFQIPLTMNRGQHSEVNIHLMHRLDVNSRQLTADKALVSLRRDATVAMVVNIARPFPQVLQELECRAQLQQVAAVLHRAGYINVPQEFTQEVMGIMKYRQQKLNFMNQRTCLVQVPLRKGNEQHAFQAALQLNPATGHCRFIGLRTPAVGGQHLVFFPDRLRRLPEASSMQDVWREFRSVQKPVNWSQALLDHQPRSRDLHIKR